MSVEILPQVVPDPFIDRDPMLAALREASMHPVTLLASARACRYAVVGVRPWP